MLSLAVFASTPVASSMRPILMGSPDVAGFAAVLAAGLLEAELGAVETLAAGLDAGAAGAEEAGAEAPPQPARRNVATNTRHAVRDIDGYLLPIQGRSLCVYLQDKCPIEYATGRRAPGWPIARLRQAFAVWPT